MKTMTCRQLGGPCDLEHTRRDRRRCHQRPGPPPQGSGKGRGCHHQPARDEMKGRWRHPKKSMGWYRDMKKAFAAPPEKGGPELPATSAERVRRTGRRADCPKGQALNPARSTDIGARSDNVRQATQDGELRLHRC